MIDLDWSYDRVAATRERYLSPLLVTFTAFERPLLLRRDIAEAMAHRKFFKTYGSNLMACAAGRAVLRVIDEALEGALAAL